MDDFGIKPILESLLFISDSPIRFETLVEVLPESTQEAILNGLQELKTEYEEPSKGVELVEVAGGYQFRTKPRWAEWVHRLKKVKAFKLSRSALETLAILAYRQPVTRPAIEEIRGVDSGWVLRTLLERGLIKMMGRKDVTELEKASIESYAMKPKKYLLPLVDEYRKVMEPFKFFLPNGGPYAFADVAEGKIDCYFERRQPYVDVFSGIFIAELDCSATARQQLQAN